MEISDEEIIKLMQGCNNGEDNWDEVTKLLLTRQYTNRYVGQRVLYDRSSLTEDGFYEPATEKTTLENLGILLIDSFELEGIGAIFYDKHKSVKMKSNGVSQTMFGDLEQLDNLLAKGGYYNPTIKEDYKIATKSIEKFVEIFGELGYEKKSIVAGPYMDNKGSEYSTRIRFEGNNVSLIIDLYKTFAVYMYDYRCEAVTSSSISKSEGVVYVNRDSILEMLNKI